MRSTVIESPVDGVKPTRASRGLLAAHNKRERPPRGTARTWGSLGSLVGRRTGTTGGEGYFKDALSTKSPKTVNNVLTVLKVPMRTVVL